MSTTIKVKVKAGSEGELFVPASLLRDTGFVVNDEATLTLIKRGFIVKQEAQGKDRLDELVSKGIIALSDPEELLARENESEALPLEELHAMLEGVTVPVEEMIRAERDKRDDILHRSDLS
jgi:hypothetical protein